MARAKAGLLRARRWVTLDTPIAIALLLLLLTSAGAVLWRVFLFGDDAPGYLNDLWPEFVGLTFDVLFILVVFSAFEAWRFRGLEIERQREIIDDFKTWDSEEAHFRIAGAMRRLAKRGITAFDLKGLRLSRFSFREHRIGSISGSAFYDGDWGQLLGRSDVELREVSFSGIDCSRVCFSPFAQRLGPAIYVRGATLIDCSFEHADLSGATFGGAVLRWTEPPPESRVSYEGDDGEGYPILVPNSYGPFDGAKLADADFSGAKFENADFRGALDLKKAKFTGAEGLETAHFDDDRDRDAVLRQVQPASGSAP